MTDNSLSLNNKLDFNNFRKEKQKPILSIIITLRQVQHYDMIERLEFRKLFDQELLNSIEFIVIEDIYCHSNEFGVENINVKKRCEDLGFNYIRYYSKQPFFNAGKARNIGAQYASGDYICHEDVDLISYGEQYYSDILTEITINNLAEDNKKFISIPAMYLTEEASKSFFELPKNHIRSKHIQYLLENDRSKFTFYMPASSVIIVNRYHYLAIGGYNEDFNGWGLEDLEYAYRLTRTAQQFYTPTEFKTLVTSPEFSLQYDYKGWRTQFRLHGDLVGQKGIIIFHLFHPVDRSWRNKNKHNNNNKLFEDCINKFEKNGQYLSPLKSRLNERSLMFGKGTFVYNNAMRPLWGDIDIKGYEYFEDIDIIQYIKENEISRVIFTNPYANETRIATYNKIIENKVPFYVVERGALNDSIFIDDSGFCCESTKYTDLHWDKDISENEIESTKNYITTEINSDSALEKQSSRKSERTIRDELNIPNFKKIIFVPLQSRSDTTVNFFAGDIESFDNFINLVQELANNIPKNWQIIVKRHPLSKINEDIKNVIFVDNYHVKDLIGMSDYVLLMNSGVGVLSVMWNKPVIYTAQTFYASSKLNRKAKTYQDVLDIINSNFKPKESDCIKFISYLIHDFYSFGTMRTRLRTYTDKSNLTITDRIDIYNLNFEGKNYYRLLNTNNKINFNSVIYSPFKKFIVENILRKKVANSTITVKSNISQPRPNEGIKIVENGKEVSKFRRKLLKLKNNPKLFFKDMLKNFKKKFSK